MRSYFRLIQFKTITIGILFPTVALVSCTSSSSFNNLSTTSASPTPSPTPTTAAGAKALKIIFKTVANGGSFASPPSLGTPVTPGSGVQVTKLFNVDGTVLASAGPTGANWPAWLTSFELGISGASNTSSQNSHCANFADSTESTVTNCNIGAAAKCGAPSGQFRVSEADCSLGVPAATAGNGGPTDGVYFRAQFSRNTANLGAAENLLVVIEYVASALNPAPSNPVSCFSSSDGSFSPETCSDFVWRAYIKHSLTEYVQPFLLLVPPTYTSALAPGATAPNNAGTNLVAKQFIVPLAGDANLTVLQISRVTSSFPSAANLLSYCTPGSLPGDSPLCAGIIFYSITFYRI